MRELCDLPTGARVTKPSASYHDLAYKRTGTVKRETLPRSDGREHLGVLWDGANVILEYEPETLFAEEGE